MKPKTLSEIVKILVQHRKELEENYGIRKVKIFGSYVKGKQTHKSDLDLIVEFNEIPTLIELVRIEEELSKLLGIKVDLLTDEGISPFIRPHIKEIEVLK